MCRIARIALLVCVVSLGTVPVLAWGGGGGHGGGGHGDGGHGGGGHHGPGHAGFVHGFTGGFVHGFSRHGVFFGGAICGSCGYFGTDMGDFTWEEYLDRIGPIPKPGDLTEEDLDAADPDDRWSGRISAAEEEAQYRYDHRGGGD